jgi:hypothetical protein
MRSPERNGEGNHFIQVRPIPGAIRSLVLHIAQSLPRSEDKIRVNG